MRHVLVLALATSWGLFAQPEQSLTTLSNQPQTLQNSEQKIYRLQVPAGQVVEVSVHEKQGMAGILYVEQNGREVMEVDFATRLPTAKHVSLGAGDWQLRLAAANHSMLPRSFEISVGAFRAVVAKDKDRFQAERAVGTGEALLRTFDPNSLEDALANFRAALDLWKHVGDRFAQADALDHIGFVLHFRGEMAAALEAYQQALDLSKAEDDASGIAAALYGLAHTNHDITQYAKASDLAGQALNLCRSLGDHAGQANALVVLGLGSLAKGEHDRARTYFTEMLDAARKAGDTVRESDAENDLGLLEFQLGNYAIAEPHYSRALAIEREENEPVRVAQELNNLGALYFSTGDLRQALRYQQEALPIRKQFAQPGSYANTLYNVADDQVALGEYQEALDNCNAALPIFRRVSHRQGEAYTLQLEGTIFLWLGENSKAEETLRQALAIRRAISDRRGEIQTLNFLGELHARDHRNSESLAEHREALSISRAAGYQREEAQTLGYLGDRLLATGDARGALESLAQSLDLAHKIGARLAEAGALHSQGRAMLQLGETGAARQALTKALGIQRESGARSAAAGTNLDLAKLDLSIGEMREAAADIADALEVVESIRVNFDSSQSRLDVAASHRAFYDLAIEIEMQRGDAGKAFEISERARARGLLDLLGEAKVDFRQGIEPALLARERQVQELLDAKHDRLMRLLMSNHSAALEASRRRELDELVDRYQAVETEIRVKSPRYAAITQPRPLSLSQVQSLLPESGTSLLEFWLGEKHSYVWLVSKTGCRGFTLPPRAAVEALARRVYETLNARSLTRSETLAQREHRLSAARAEFARIARQLSAQLLSPIMPPIERGVDYRRIWIVADGALAYVPFAALPVPSSDTPLVKDHEIAGLPSASVLSALVEQSAARQPPDRLVAVFADPVFRANDERVTGRRTTAAAEDGLTDLPRLYFSRQEAEAIRQFAPPGQTLAELDFSASRAKIESDELGRYRVIHFATHGLLDSRHPELSGIALSMVDRRGNPQEGLLRLHEIYNLKLNADLVVLSGCETALGEEVRGEGLIGLARGFMYSGSQQVMASLWSVRDRAAAQLMRNFYEGLLVRHLSPAAALRSAQLAMRRDSRWSDPYYWAAFTLQGARSTRNP